MARISGIAIVLSACFAVSLARASESQPSQIDLGGVFAGSDLSLKFMAVKPTTTTPSNMDRAALDRWLATGGPYYMAASNDKAMALPIARTISGLRLRPSARKPEELDLRYRLEITADGKQALLLYISIRGELLRDGRAYEVVTKANWLRKLWSEMLPTAYAPK